MQRQITNLDIKQPCTGYESALQAINARYNSRAYGLVFRFLEYKKQVYYILFRNIKSKIVDKYRLCVLFKQNFSNTIHTNCEQLLAYLGGAEHDFIADMLAKSLKNQLGGPILDGISVKAVFEKTKTDPRFKTEERRVIMA